MEIEKYVRIQIEKSPNLLTFLWERTENNEYPELQSFAVMGLNEEAGEVAGLACRECYKKKDIPKYKWIEELGDTLWYLVVATLAKGLTLEELWQYNVKKLEERYGDGEQF